LESDRINSWLALAANAGVIAGIVFLAIELRQNNELLTLEANYAQINMERGRRSRIIENEGFADLIDREKSGKELTSVENMRLRLHWLDVIDTWEWQFRENRAGRLEDEVLNLADWRVQWVIFSTVQTRYQETADRRDPEFLVFMEENVISKAP
jgi:hypothetical protein